jgi:hypothetical protein
VAGSVAQSERRIQSHKEDGEIGTFLRDDSFAYLGVTEYERKSLVLVVKGAEGKEPQVLSEFVASYPPQSRFEKVCLCHSSPLRQTETTGLDQ